MSFGTSLLIETIVSFFGKFLKFFFGTRGYYKEIGLFLKPRLLKEVYNRKKKKPTRIGKKLENIISGWKEDYIHFENREKKILEGIRDNKNIRIIDESGRGKTRTTLEVIRKLVREDIRFKKTSLFFLSTNSDFSYAKKFRKLRIRKYPHLILFFDDIDKILTKLDQANISVDKLIEYFGRITKNLQCICTCRKEKWFLIDRARHDILRLLDEKDNLKRTFPIELSIPLLSNSEGSKLSKELNLSFPSTFTGNAADIVLKTYGKRTEYEKLNIKYQLFLHTVKLFFLVNIHNPFLNIVRTTAKKLFQIGEESYLITEDLVKSEFFTISSDRIYIHDIYLEQVIYDYPPESFEILEDHMKILRDILFKEQASKELNFLASKFRKLNNKVDSLICLNLAIRIDDINPFFYNNRGIIHREIEDYESAIKDFSKAIRINPRIAGPYYNKGISLFKLAEYEDAIEEFNKSIELEPNFTNAYLNRGNCFNSLGKIDEAIDDFSKSLEFDKHFTLALYNRGKAFLEKHRYVEAKQDLDNLLKIEPNEIDALYYSAFSSYKMNCLDEAIKKFSTIIELNNGYLYAYFYRGLALFDKSEKERAKADFLLSLKLDIRKFDSKLALEAIEHIIDIEPTNENHLILKSWFHFLDGDYESAIIENIKAKELNPNSALVYANLSIIFFQTGEKEKSLKELDEAIKLDYRVLFLVLRKDFLDETIISCEFASILLLRAEDFKDVISSAEKEIIVKSEHLINQLED